MSTKATMLVVAGWIGQLHPAMPQAQRRAYAHAVVSVAPGDERVFVALIEHESRWLASSVSPDGEDHGLGAVRARHYGACRSDTDPVRDPSAACRRSKLELLEPSTNLRVAAQAWRSNRWLCKRKTGRTDWEVVLAGYAGLSSPRLGRWCGLVKRGRRWVEDKRVATGWKRVREVLAITRSLRPSATTPSTTSRSRLTR